MANKQQQYQYSDPNLGGQRELNQNPEVSENLQNVNQNVMKFLRDRPGAALLGALAAGFLFGRLFGRR